MPELSEKEMLEKLQGFSTPTVGNVVANLPESPYCLRIYDNEKDPWYTDQSVHCIFPELGRRVGYAATIVVSEPDPKHPPLTFQDLILALGKARKPIILVTQQVFPPEKLNRMGLWGGQSTSLFKACGVVGVVTNGPSRDIDEIREMKIQYVMSGTTPEHGIVALSAMNVPVSVAGMDVTPDSDIIHMDEHGACKFPANRLQDICRNIDAFSQEEETIAKSLLAAGTVQEILAAWKE